MIDRLMGILSRLKNAQYSIRDIYSKCRSLFDRVIEHPTVKGILDKVDAALANVTFLIPIIFIAISALLVWKGKKLFPILRFFAVLAAGMAGGVLVVTPVIRIIFPTVSSLVVGLAVGILLAIFSKFTYYFVAMCGIVYVAHYYCYVGRIPFIPAGKLVIGLAIGLALFLVFVLLRSYMEKMLPAAAGGFLVAYSVCTFWYNFAALSIFGGRRLFAYGAVMVVFAILGLVFQKQKRRRYAK